MMQGQQVVNFGSQSDLIARLAFAMQDDSPRPLAFLTGSGLSVPAVPGVTTTLRLLREEFPSDEQQELDDFLKNFKEPGEKYRQAFQFMGLRRPPAFAERILKLATLSAYDRSGISLGELLGKAVEHESNIDSWQLPAGQAALGRMLSGMPDELRGPVFTTNFDPLTEIAVRRAGGVATSYVHVDDSSFLANLRVQTGTSVVHLHGYWRDSQVLNTSDQLELDRPSLSASLRVILERHTLVVLGYGGWSDVISRSILDAVSEQRTEDLDVLWCLFTKERDLVSANANQDAIEGFAQAPSSIRFYAGIDANEMLPALEKRIAPILNYDSAKRIRSAGSSLVGWNTITSGSLEATAANATSASAISFFDGRLPSLYDAISPHIPLRELSIEILNLVVAADGDRASSLNVITGPSGEGKSMVVLQAAALVAKQHSEQFRVFMLDGDHFGAVDSILRLPETSSYLLVVDEAHKFVTRIQDLVKELQESGRNGLHLLIASGDTDWAASGGSSFAWSRFIRAKNHELHGLSHVDASAMVGAWEQIGDDALGELKTFHTSDERVDALLSYSFGEEVAGHGTLLGALLSTRYDRLGLRDHIRELLERLRARSIPGASNASLLEVLIAIAVPHAYGVYALSPSVLADAFEFNKTELMAYVLIPLGEEAAITYASGHIVVRHELIAASIVDLCLEMGFDIETATRRVVTAATTQIVRGGYSPGLAQLAYLSTRITDIPKLALAAANAAVDAAPQRLSYHTTRSKVLRDDQRAKVAAQKNEEALPLLFNAENVNQARSFFVEWGVVEGLLGNFARNAVLAGVALQDGTALGRLTVDGCDRGISCLLLAVRRLNDTSPHLDFVKALAAATVVARATRASTGHSAEWLRAAERVVDRSGLPYPRLEEESLIEEYLSAGLSLSAARLESEFPIGFPRTDFQFRSMQKLASGWNVTNWK